MDEAISLLHETCHGLHSLACKTKYAELHGTSVARDFVEIPPMVVENLFSIVRFVKDVSCHYSHTSEEYARMWREDQIAKDGEHVQDIDQVPLPPRQLSDEIIDALIRRRRMKKQSANLSTLHHSLFDMAMHDPESHAEIEAMDLTETWNKLRKTATLLDGPEVLGEGWRWGAGHTRLQNINIGYDAGYYTYLTYVLRP
jgi:metallopeptidase MepB